ncbi:MAG: divergent PAP2 family protein [Oscillospiraceae bacterium]|nr:divergent PAP2 family protein [Oscillospiraceae bacterium]
MKGIVDLVTNQFVLSAVTAWLAAQILKVIIHAVIYKKFDIMRLFGDGGMPSGHSATVSSLATASGIVFGLSSFQFAISAIFALIVCHDAMGVRRETGKQAVILNEIMESFNVLATKKLPEVKLKEFVGHTPVQVMSGILLGIINAFVLHYILFW